MIHKTFICRQSHRTNEQMFINIEAENNHHLNITPLKTPQFRSLAPKVYDTEKRNLAKTRSHEREIDLTPKTLINLVIAKNLGYINLYNFYLYYMSFFYLDYKKKNI